MTKAPASPRVGYLINLYPAVSHSFIKREILALEARGLTIRRWSIRSSASNLPDESDLQEAQRTEVVLASAAAVLMAVGRMLLARPVRVLQCLPTALAGRQAGLRSALLRLAYLAEACFVTISAQRHRVEHIHAHFGTNSALVARLVFLLGGPTYSFTVHGPDEFDQPLVHDLEGKIADARFVAAISDYGRSQLMRWSRPADWSKIHVVRCGLDDAFLLGEPEPIANDTAATLVCVARLAPQKGLPVLIEAVVRLAQLMQGFRIVVIGEGELRRALQVRIDSAGIKDFVELRGAASMSDVRSAILAARGFVLPSFAEGLPVSIMEALALERPVITTRIAGIPELVDDTCGRVITPGDIDGLVSAMREVLTKPATELRAMGAEGRRRVRASHDITVIAAQLAGLFGGPESC